MITTQYLGEARCPTPACGIADVVRIGRVRLVICQHCAAHHAVSDARLKELQSPGWVMIDRVPVEWPFSFQKEVPLLPDCPECGRAVITKDYVQHCTRCRYQKKLCQNPDYCGTGDADTLCDHCLEPYVTK